MTPGQCDALYKALRALQQRNTGEVVDVHAKRKGTAREHRSIALLEADGYRCTRAAASLGAWDIIGIGAAEVVLVQVKSRDWPGSGEMATLRAFPCPSSCKKLVHRWRDRHPVPDVQEV